MEALKMYSDRLRARIAPDRAANKQKELARLARLAMLEQAEKNLPNTPGKYPVTKIKTTIADGMRSGHTLQVFGQVDGLLVSGVNIQLDRFKFQPVPIPRGEDAFPVLEIPEDPSDLHILHAPNGLVRINGCTYFGAHDSIITKYIGTGYDDVLQLVV